MRIISRLKHIHQYQDRHGHIRRYFRRRGQPQVALPGAPGSSEFMQAYYAALAAPPASQPKPRPVDTIDATIAAYYADRRSGFAALATVTQANRRAILKRFAAVHGGFPLSELSKTHIVVLLSKLTPAAATGFLKALRHLMQYAVTAELRADDPTQGIGQVKAPRPEDPDQEVGYHSWTEDEISQFTQRHPFGSKPHLAMTALICTGLRRKDIVRLGWQHLKDGEIAIRAAKTRKMVHIPLHPDLAEVLGATERGEQLTFIRKQNDAPYTAESFGNMFRDWCNEAGLPQCSAHGLRKAICRRLAEAGCTAPQIQAITGHTLKEVQRYIDAADRRTLASAAFARLLERRANTGGTPGCESRPDSHPIAEQVSNKNVVNIGYPQKSGYPSGLRG